MKCRSNYKVDHNKNNYGQVYISNGAMVLNLKYLSSPVLHACLTNTKYLFGVTIYNAHINKFEIGLNRFLSLKQ